MKPKAYWIHSPLSTRWGSAASLSNAFKSKYHEEFELTEIESKDILASFEDGIFIFGDIHYPREVLLEKLAHLPSGTKVLFHLYGDIFSRIKIFEENKDLFFHLLFKFSLGSISAYESAKKMVSGENLIYRPYFLGNLPQRNDIKRTGINKIIYFGRISYFKNVHHLVTLFDEFTDSHPDYELHIAGGIDNFRWRNAPTGSYFNYGGELFDNALERVHARGKRVFYHGRLEQKDLFRLAQEMTTFTTLSTCEEEDFGASIAEALSLGLNIVATQWGGHKQFKDCQNTNLVEVSQIRGNLKIDRDELFRAWANPTKEGEIISDKNQFWKNTKSDFGKWRKLDQFSNEFSHLKASTIVNKEFYEHAEAVLYPLWK